MEVNFTNINFDRDFQLTKDTAKFIFDDLVFHYTGQKYYNDNAYIKSIKQIYRNPKTGKRFTL